MIEAEEPVEDVFDEGELGVEDPEVPDWGIILCSKRKRNRKAVKSWRLRR